MQILNTKAKTMTEVEIYTDGACSGNPGAGGWGALLLHAREDGQIRKEIFGGEPATTNNRMEVTAAIMALRALKKPCKVILYSDSKYLTETMSFRIKSWVMSGWRGANGKPVKNVDLWKQLLIACSGHEINWVWVRGHSGVSGNEIADRLANKGVLSVSK